MAGAAAGAAAAAGELKLTVRRSLYDASRALAA